jgi:hypothetical protein
MNYLRDYELLKNEMSADMQFSNRNANLPDELAGACTIALYRSLQAHSLFRK